MVDQPLRIAVLGLGEAGSAFVSDLRRAGADVVGYDPRDDLAVAVRRAGTAAAAAAEADLVISVNAAAVAERVAAEVLPVMRAGAVFADLNTGAPQSKRRIGALALGFGVPFAEVAVMAPVPGKGVAVPAVATGPGAGSYAEMMGRYGAKVEVIDAPIGTAATRKLLRSVVMKGLAAAILEALEAADRAGCAPWLRDDLNRLFGAALVARLEEGTYVHAGRRAVEMAAVCELLDDLEVRPLIAEAARQRLLDLTGRPARQRPVVVAPAEGREAVDDADGSDAAGGLARLG